MGTPSRRRHRGSGRRRVTGSVPTLHLVATPIGNLGDLAPRAITILGSVALVCCEDTRRTGRLLQHAGIKAARLAVCNEHTELSRIADVLKSRRGRRVASSPVPDPGSQTPGERWCLATLDPGLPCQPCPGARRRDGTRDLAPTSPTFRGLPPAVRQGTASTRRHRGRNDGGDYERPPHRAFRSRACGDDRQVAIAANSPSCTRRVARLRSARSTRDPRRVCDRPLRRTTAANPRRHDPGP